MNNKYILIAIVVTVVVIGVGAYFALSRQKPPSPQVITNFEECAKAGYPVGESHPRQCWTPDGRHFVEELGQDPPLAPEPITISGEMTCLPKIGTGPQTLECAIGLKGEDGRHYELRNLSDHNPGHKFSTVGLRVEISGTFDPEGVTGPAGKMYDAVGAIDINSIKAIEN